MPKKKGKAWFRSKTLWWNFITLVLGVVEVYSGVYYVPTDVLALVNGAGNVFLRMVTDSKLDFS
tara:strand:+ start:59 stop:250 length:192 start_codon:yes stop_codon:yes gene_type:complete